jgi:phenylalanyl-tRNA synthetase alpha chain
MNMTMEYQNPDVARIARELKTRMAATPDKQSVLRAPELKSLYEQIRTLSTERRAAFGMEVNKLKQELEQMAMQAGEHVEERKPIDVTAPFAPNTPAAKRPHVLPTELGSQHPLTTEIAQIIDIFARMGFGSVESRQIDDDFHMFEALNFPADHPARDDYDTFMTTEGLIAPAHTSTMQNRVLRKYKPNLEKGESISVIIPDRVFRNEDLDARHEHTFYQIEGIYVSKGVTVGNLIATLKTFLETYYEQELEVKTQPFYFPFTEPSFEFALSCPFCNKKGCNVCSYSGWIELLGCGMIHPNVLKAADIDPTVYTGFAWGCGIDRLVFMKYDIEDIRYFESGKLEFLRQFK